MSIVPNYEVLYDADAAVTSMSDCNCACPPPPRAAKTLQLPDTALVQTHPHMQSLAISPEHVVAFVPSESRVAVLNHPTCELLTHLQKPTLIAALGEAEREVAWQLLALGLVTQCHTRVEPAVADELIAWLHVTNACNLRCTYCYLHKTEEAMTAETAYAAIDAVLRSASLHGYKRVLLKYAGGEASLNLALVETMHHYAIEQASANGISLSGVVLSNGVALTHRRLQMIQNLGLRLMISLDGLQPVHDQQRPTIKGQGSFKAVIAGIERAQECGLDLTISVTVTGASVTGLPELVGWLLNRKLHFTLNFYRDNDCSTQQHELALDQQRLIEGMRAAYQVIEQALPYYSLLGCLLDRAHLGGAHRRTCGVGENYLVIDQRGQVAKGQMEIDQPVSSVWAADPLLTIRLDQHGIQNLAVEQKEGCRDCQWRFWCTGGCAVATYRATGRYDIKSPNCEIYKALYPDVLRLEGLRILQRHQPARA